MTNTERLFWDLAGPRRFVETVCRDLEEERHNIVIGMPQHGPQGLCEAVEDQIRRSDRYFFKVIANSATQQSHQTPEQVIHENLAELSDSRVTPSLDTVAESTRLQESVVWVNVADNDVSDWLAFVEAYRARAHAGEESERPLFVLCITGKPPQQLPQNEVHLRVWFWRGIVSKLDMQMFASQLYEFSGLLRVYRELAIHIAIELAVSDPVAVQRLCQCPLERLMDPEEELKLIAQERGWTKSWAKVRDMEPDQLWARGFADTVDGQWSTHGAFEIVSAPNKRELEGRLWRAQVGILFPLLEDCRSCLLEKFGDNLNLPVYTKYETINDKALLEFSHIKNQLQPFLEPRLMQDVECCWSIRNDLAHFKPASHADVFSEAVQLMAKNIERTRDREARSFRTSGTAAR